MDFVALIDEDFGEGMADAWRTMIEYVSLVDDVFGDGEAVVVPEPAPVTTCEVTISPSLLPYCRILSGFHHGNSQLWASRPAIQHQ